MERLPLDEQLDAATEALRAGQLPAALAALIGAWRLQRLPRIAQLAEWVSARLGPPSPIDAQAEWLRRADAQDAHALPGLLATLTAVPFRAAETRADHLVRWEDPRVTSGLLAVLAAPRYRSSGAKWFYDRLFRALAAQRDPRAPPALVALANRYHEVVTNSWGPEQARRLRDEAAKMTVDTSSAAPSTELRLDALERFFESERADVLRAEAQTSALVARLASLRAQVEERPDDDGLRQVWADALVEQGDPRGELVTFQLMERQGPLGAAQLEQLRAVQAKHRDRLLGAIAPKVVNAVFDRGLPAHVEVGRGSGTPEATEPEWKHVRGVTLPVERWQREGWVRFLAALPALETVLRVDATLVRLLYAARPGFTLAHALFEPSWENEALPAVRHAMTRDLELARRLGESGAHRRTLAWDGPDPASAVAALRFDAERLTWVDGAHLLDPEGWYGWRFDFEPARRRLAVAGRFSGAPQLERLDVWLAVLAGLGPREVVLDVTVPRDAAYLPLTPLHDDGVVSRLAAVLGRPVERRR